MKDYEFLEHTADVKFRARGGDLDEAYLNSARALLETMYSDLDIEAKVEKKIEVEGEDKKSLLYTFLEEFLFLLDSEGFVCSRIKGVDIDTEGKKLKALVIGDDAKDYKFANDVKAITYSDMIIEEKDGGWVIEGVFDV